MRRYAHLALDFGKRKRLAADDYSAFIKTRHVQHDRCQCPVYLPPLRGQILFHPWEEKGENGKWCFRGIRANRRRVGSWSLKSQRDLAALGIEHLGNRGVLLDLRSSNFCIICPGTENLNPSPQRSILLLQVRISAYDPLWVHSL